jgi:L-ascorbate metabolism protein UlaG (beta-lactamase superfamily)
MARQQRRHAARLAAAWIALLLGMPGCAGNQPRDRGAAPDDAACRSLLPVSAGGPRPPRGTLVLRWLGTSNYELAYGDQVVLLDAFFDRGPRNRPIGVPVEAIRRASVILVGHGHYDHVADAARVARQTGAVVVGAATAIAVVRAAGLPAEKTVTVTGRGGEALRFGRLTVEPVLARHSTLDPRVLEKFGEAMALVDTGATQAELAQDSEVAGRGSSDPAVRTEGTIAYLVTIDAGVRILWLDSAGPITDQERELMRRIGSVGVAIVAYQGQFLAAPQIRTTLPLVQLFNPRLYLPAHHDAIAGLFPDLGVEPLLSAIRDSLPATRTVAPLYREPVCVDARTGRRVEADPPAQR